MTTNSSQTTIQFSMPDSMLSTIEDLVALRTQPDAEPTAFVRCPVSKHFDDDGIEKDDWWVGSVFDADKKPWSWRAAVLEWDGVSPWTGPSPDAPSVSQRLCMYLSILHGWTGGHMNVDDALELAQRRLSRLLVEHPVLLHPRMSVSVSGPYGKGKVSVAHALCLSTKAVLPMAKHGVSAAELESFANHPCTLLGLLAKHVKVKGELKDAVGRRPLDLGLANYEYRPDLLASVHELDKLVRPASWPVQVGARPFMTLFADKSKAPVGFVPMAPIVKSFVAACGCFHQVGGARPTRRYEECPEYLAFLRESGISTSSLFHNHVAHELGQALIPGALSAFRDGPMQGPGPSYDQVVEGCERVLRGLVAIGLVGEPTETSSAHVIRNTLAGAAPPHCHLEHALAVIRTLASRGVEMTPDDFSSSRTRDVWSEALRVHQTEVEMAKAIRTAQHPEASQASPGMVRRRLL